MLTPREIAVMESVASGNANKIIAHELGLSEHTVKVHVRNSMKKLGASNRTQAANKYRGAPEENRPEETFAIEIAIAFTQPGTNEEKIAKIVRAALRFRDDALRARP